MKSVRLVLLAILFLAACGRNDSSTSSAAGSTVAAAKAQTLSEARSGFTTRLRSLPAQKFPIEKPPPGTFIVVRYDAPPVKLAAYLTPDPKDGKKRPAIIWITGGDCNSIGDVWNPGPRDNEQSASAYRKAGIVMMFPSLRGGNDNPGRKEGFLGEVDDLLAAREFLAKQPWVDPSRIYLGGHSTGGTLALLVAECSDKFRAVFSFGPVDDVSGYGPKYGPPVDLSDLREIDVRSPAKWLHGIKPPTFVIEGTRGNIDSLRQMSRTSKNSQLHFLPVNGATHFTILAPVNELIAKRILQDNGAACEIALTEDDLQQLFR